MKRTLRLKALGAPLCALLSLGMLTACNDGGQQPTYAVAIPQDAGFGAVTAADFAPRRQQSTHYGKLESEVQPVVRRALDVTVLGADLADNEFVEVSTDKQVKLGSQTATASFYDRAFDTDGTKPIYVEMKQTADGTYDGTVNFNIARRNYALKAPLWMCLYNNAMKEDDFAKAAFGTTTESKIKALADLGYQGAYAYTTLADWDLLKANGLASAGANTLSDKVGDAYKPGYSKMNMGEQFVVSAMYFKEHGYQFGNFDLSYYFAGMQGLSQGLRRQQMRDPEPEQARQGGPQGGMPGGPRRGPGGPGGGPGGPGAGAAKISYNDYVRAWENGVKAAVNLNKEIAAAAEKFGYTPDFYVTQENEPMGNTGQSAIEVAMYNAAIAHASQEAGVKNYVKVTIDLVHTYSFLFLDLQNKDISADLCIEYLNKQPWAVQYFREKLGSEIRKPRDIHEYMKLLDGNVCSIQFSDNNAGTVSPFGGQSKGSATGSHHLIGEGVIDWNDFMDALFNDAHIGETASASGGSYLVYEPWYNNIADEAEKTYSQQHLVEGIADGPAWMKEFNLLYNTNKQAPAPGKASVEKLTGDGQNILIPCYGVIDLTAGSTDAGFSVQNPAKNPCKFVISLITDDGRTLFTSKQLKAGSKAKVKLTEPLQAGTYNAVLKYDATGNAGQPLNGATVAVVLNVK